VPGSGVGERVPKRPECSARIARHSEIMSVYGEFRRGCLLTAGAIGGYDAVGVFERQRFQPRSVQPSYLGKPPPDAECGRTAGRTIIR